MKTKRIVLNAKEAEAVTAVIENGISIADAIYPFVQPSYDEDAGVFTDHGKNDADRTWAGIHFRNLLQNAVIDQSWGSDNGSVQFRFLDISIPALVQGLHRFYSDKNLQRGCLQRAAVNLWESDGHYGSQTRDEFVEETIGRMAIDRKLGKTLCEKLNDL